MPTFYVIDGVKIQLFFRDHNPPHFHAEFAEYKALIRIDDRQVLEGKLPKNKQKKILTWAKEHQEELMEIWLELQMTDED
ncbi:DUF4160 domain-containing protein [Neolewinella agarilytica]|uniref:DUF4160 domain-containing protein n=1 Tax=Neolewinella agarilytica TaxID=478744 RepID=A0A1H9IY04_9BACT|nr:DUF4160 domain-containing protein [Neolewinella agarilytica]SEQ79483.1 protein of unknown function [Neolewinella agarilytica]